MVDLHIHGVGRHDTRGSADDIIAVSRALGPEISFVPTVYAGPTDEMRRAMGNVRDAMAEGNIHGINLEGPYLNPARSGALDKDSFITRPKISDFMRLIEGYEDIVRIITIAPELPGALKLIARAAELGIRVNMGHSDATYAQALEGRRAGATGVTHLFNAMRPLHHREPGLAGLALTDPELYVELIPDGVHIAPEVVRMVFALKPASRILAVSDAVRGPHKKGGVLQGSAITLREGYERLLKMGIPVRAARMATDDNPRRYLK